MQILIANVLYDLFPLLYWFQASQDKKSLDVGANLFVGNLDPVSSIRYFLFILLESCIVFSTCVCVWTHERLLYH